MGVEHGVIPGKGTTIRHVLKMIIETWPELAASALTSAATTLLLAGLIRDV